MPAPTPRSARAPTGFVFHPRFLEHDTGPEHVERPARLRAILERLEADGLMAELDALQPGPAPLAALEAVHAPEHVRAVEQACGELGERRRAFQAEDTVISCASGEAARLAAGAVIEACERVLDGRWSRAFAAPRPPGHHAEAGRAMGFCLFNSVAVGARWLRSAGLERVAIVDWDVHHGNGTQHLFERDPSVLFVSLHQYPHYPGTGAESERGLGQGEGATLNLPLPAGSGEPEWLRRFEGEALPAIEAFAPEFVLVSAGFDAHRADPLSDTLLREQSYARMTRGLLEAAGRSAGGRLVSSLEGGYDLEALAASVSAHVGELLAD
jgi:acetoin utilization deacetylase AcuC-like enzyme